MNIKLKDVFLSSLSCAADVEQILSGTKAGDATLDFAYSLKKISENLFLCTLTLKIGSESKLVHIDTDYTGLFEMQDIPDFSEVSDSVRELGAYCLSRIMPYVHELARDISSRFPRAIFADLSIFKASKEEILEAFVDAKVIVGKDLRESGPSVTKNKKKNTKKI